MPQLGHYFFMKRSIVEGGRGGGGVGPELLFQGTVGQELLYWTPYGKSLILKRARQHYSYSGIHFSKNGSWIFFGFCRTFLTRTMYLQIS